MRHVDLFPAQYKNKNLKSQRMCLDCWHLTYMTSLNWRGRGRTSLLLPECKKP